MNRSTLLTLLLLSLLLLLQPTTGDDIINVYPDLMYTANLLNTPLMNRVQQIVDVRQTYSLVANMGWIQFPEMLITFDLPFSQFVTVQYVIVTCMQDPYTFQSKVLIDGKQARQFRRALSSVYKFSGYGNFDIWMQKGKHTVQAFYLTDSAKVIVDSDWNVAWLEVDYWRP